MTETAKELIENEVKSVEKGISSGRQYGKTYKYGVREGLMIALAHIQNATTLVTSEETVTINKNVYDLLINKVSKQREQITVAVEALTKSRERLGDFQEPWNDREKEVDLILSEALAEIGGKDD